MATTTSFADIQAESKQSPTCIARFNAAAGGVGVVALTATVWVPSAPVEAAVLEPPVAADTSFITLQASRQKPVDSRACQEQASRIGIEVGDRQAQRYVDDFQRTTATPQSGPTRA